MARLTDSNGALLGGLNTAPNAARTSAPKAAAASRRTPPETPPAPKWGPNEIILGLECSYGTLAYFYADQPWDVQNVRQQSRLPGCHNPIETPEERHHCETCGGDYCIVHAEATAHDCVFVIRSR